MREQQHLEYLLLFVLMLSGFNTVNPQQIDPYWYQETKFNESCEQMNGNVKKKGHTDQQHLIQIDLFCNDG